MTQALKLEITESEIRRLAKKHLETSNLLVIAMRQAFTEYKLRLRKGLSFRFGLNEKAREAYVAMTEKEFEGINARQQWANWRTIPRNMNGRVPRRPIQALDLCCGIGHSTEVLFAHLSKGSTILGLEFNPTFVALAEKRSSSFSQDSEPKTTIAFRAQSVLDPFCDKSGRMIDSDTIDLVNSCGAIGNHFDAEKTAVVAKEVARVLRPGGIALIDSGNAGTSTDVLISIFSKLNFDVLSRNKSCVIDLYTQVCFQKRKSADTPKSLRASK